MSVYKGWAIKFNGQFVRDYVGDDVHCAIFKLKRDAENWKGHYITLESAKVVKVTVTVQEVKP